MTDEIVVGREQSLASVNALNDRLDQIYLDLGNASNGPNLGRAALTLTDAERIALREASTLLQQAREVLTHTFYPYPAKAGS